MRTFILLLLAIGLSACSTPQLKLEHLEGDTSAHASTLEHALERTAVVYKPRALVKKQDPTQIGNATQLSRAATSVSIRMTPLTRPLIAARVRDAIHSDNAYRVVSNDSRKRMEEDRAVAQALVRYSAGKQCFDTAIVVSNYAVANNKNQNAPPKEAQLANWSGTVVQGSRRLQLTTLEGPHCQPQSARTFSAMPYQTRFAVSEDFECRMVMCTSASLQLRQGMTVEYRPSYERGLLPVALEWPSIERRNENRAATNRKVAAREATTRKNM